MANQFKTLETKGLKHGLRVSSEQGLQLAQENLAAGNRPFEILLRGHDNLEVEYYAPPPPDTQKPHDRDELYFVERGSGWFIMGNERVRFAPGDLLFVPAGLVHRFEDYAELGVWVVFYGPRTPKSSV